MLKEPKRIIAEEPTAQEYSIETDMTVDEIAQHVGYNSSTQLSRVFKKYENMTPTDYRNSYK